MTAALLLFGCSPQDAAQKERLSVANPVAYFEIPVSDMERAIAFYSRVFQLELERETVDGYEMALFPAGGGPGATGALAKGEVYVPSRTGPVLYFSVDDIDMTLTRAKSAGGQMLYPKTAVGTYGWVAEISDSEGNRIGLSQR